ncbi:hypothetical protein Naga_100003g145 [Nannochloropsis gaditana]|uniref:Uncharacterized protein n=1 Tax=Nannochloropsis gaditana TaxID=72520 RepID=W7UBI0_9STRA|nr:hypothetical protein Naga_100003g145 [Nannochloropsis gaditana]
MTAYPVLMYYIIARFASRVFQIGWTICLFMILEFVFAALFGYSGVFSVLQLLVDCAVTNDWGGINGNALKFYLGLFSIAFDLLFMIQHFVLYPTSATAVTPSKWKITFVGAVHKLYHRLMREGQNAYTLRISKKLSTTRTEIIIRFKASAFQES